LPSNFLPSVVEYDHDGTTDHDELVVVGGE
jgi:hypothetical protein